MAFRITVLDLTPSVHLQFRVKGGDGDRFARLFQEVFSRLPDNDRGIILRHWAEAVYLSLELSNSWADHAEKLGNSAACGWELQFNAEEVDLAPEDAVRCLIAHELAHVYQYASGINRTPGFEFESDAYERVKAWGFERRTWGNWEAKQQDKRDVNQ
jgi:hypothetical protein